MSEEHKTRFPSSNEAFLQVLVHKSEQCFAYAKQHRESISLQGPIENLLNESAQMNIWQARGETWVEAHNLFKYGN